MVRRIAERRGFLGVLLVKPATAFGTQANSSIEIGIVGCGTGGVWVEEMFREFAGARVVALHDVFADRVKTARGKLEAASARIYGGYDGYQDLVTSKLNAVAIESPPYCHPKQPAAAIAAGKHVYLAKPAAVDVAGCKTILTAGKRAKGRQRFFVDFQLRARPMYQECAARIHRGDIGIPVAAQVHYHTARLPRRDAGDEPAAIERLRNWVFDKALSGNIIVEQNIHALDGASWFLNARPFRAAGTGDRKIRTDAGDCWDHFVITYWFRDDVKVDFRSTQCVIGINGICIRICGSKGTVVRRNSVREGISGLATTDMTPSKTNAEGAGAVSGGRQVAGANGAKP